MYQIKGAVRISSATGIGIHRHHLQPGFQTHLENDMLRLNHYRIQSKEYFEKVKMDRGDVARADRNYRTWDYFHHWNARSSSIEDRELCTILGCCPS